MAVKCILQIMGDSLNNNAQQKRFGNRDSDRCTNCSEIETLTHLIFCNKHKDDCGVISAQNALTGQIKKWIADENTHLLETEDKQHIAVLLHPWDYFNPENLPEGSQLGDLVTAQRKYFGQLLRRTELHRKFHNADCDGEAIPNGEDPAHQEEPENDQILHQRGVTPERDGGEVESSRDKNKGTLKGGGLKSIKKDYNCFSKTQERTQASFNSAVDEKKYLWNLTEEEARKSVFLTDHQLLATLVNIEHLAISGIWANEHGGRIVFRDGHVFNSGKLSGFTKYVGLKSHDRDILNSINLSTMRYTNSLNSMRLCELSPMTLISPNLLTEIERANTTTSRYGMNRTTLQEIMPSNTDGIPTPFVTISASTPNKKIRGYVTYEDQLQIEIFLMAEHESIEEVTRLLNDTDAERLKWASGYKKDFKKEDDELKYFVLHSIRVWNMQEWGEKNTPWARFYRYPNATASENFTKVVDTQFTAKYEVLTSGRPNKMLAAPWAHHLTRFYEWSPETMQHDAMRLLTRHPDITKFESRPTPEQEYEKKCREENRELSTRKKELKDNKLSELESPPSGDSSVITPKRLNERLVFGRGSDGDYPWQDQNNFQYDAMNPDAKPKPSNRMFHNGRKYVLTVTESEDEDTKRVKGGVDDPINCWDSDESEKRFCEHLKKEEAQSPEYSSSPRSPDYGHNDESQSPVYGEGTASPDYDRAQEVEDFNTACGDYEKPYQHQRRLRTRTREDDSDDASTKPVAKKMRLQKLEKKDGSSAEEDSDVEGNVSNETIDQLAHVISDDESSGDNGYFDKAVLMKKLENMNELELQRVYNNAEEEVEKCRAKVRRRIERKFKGAKNHRKVTQLHRLKAKMKVINEEREKRLATLKKERNRLKAKKIYAVMKNSLTQAGWKKHDEKWLPEGQNPGPGIFMTQIIFCLTEKKLCILIHNLLRPKRYFTNSEGNFRSRRFQSFRHEGSQRTRSSARQRGKGGCPGEHPGRLSGRSRARPRWLRTPGGQASYGPERRRIQPVFKRLQQLRGRPYERFLRFLILRLEFDVSTKFSINDILCKIYSLRYKKAANHSSGFGFQITQLSSPSNHDVQKSDVKCQSHRHRRVCIANHHVSSTREIFPIVSDTLLTCLVQDKCKESAEDESCESEGRMEAEETSSAAEADAPEATSSTTTDGDIEHEQCLSKDKILRRTYNIFTHNPLHSATSPGLRPLSGLGLATISTTRPSTMPLPFSIPFP